MIDSIIFDLDGTMWDSCESVLHVWSNISQKYGFRPLTIEDIQGLMGLTIEDAGKKLFKDTFGEEKGIEIAKECAACENEYLEKQGGKLYPRLLETLAELKKKYRLFIVSNCECGYIEAFMKVHGTAEYFEDYEHCGNTGLLKDGNIRLIIERNKLKNPVYVGDTQTDKNASALAGIPFIYASYGFGEVDGFDAKAESFSDLPDVVKSM